MYYVFVTVGLQQWSVSLVDCVQVLKTRRDVLYFFALYIIFCILYFIQYVIMEVSSADIK